jgi:hypothetical protein
MNPMINNRQTKRTNIKKVKIIIKMVLFGLLSLIIISLCIVGSYQLILKVKLSKVQESIRPSLKLVLNSYYIGKITGEYWDDEIYKQYKVVSRTPVDTRIEYYREILINCDFGSDASYYFAEMLSSDSQDLYEALLQLKKSKRFKGMGRKEKERLESWIATLKVIINNNTLFE